MVQAHGHPAKVGLHSFIQGPRLCWIGFDAAGREQVKQYLETRRAQEDGDEFKALRRGWCLGSETFRRALLESVHTRATESHHAQTRQETTAEKARRILHEELNKLGWMGAELPGLAGKGSVLGFGYCRLSGLRSGLPG